MNTDRDKFLIEAMGECWHKKTFWSGVGIICEECNDNHDLVRLMRIDFSTWPGFGKLWNWATEQDWWSGFNRYAEGTHAMGGIPVSLINPDRFATAIYEYLKAREVK